MKHLKLFEAWVSFDGNHDQYEVDDWCVFLEYIDAFCDRYDLFNLGRPLSGTISEEKIPSNYSGVLSRGYHSSGRVMIINIKLKKDQLESQAGSRQFLGSINWLSEKISEVPFKLSDSKIVNRNTEAIIKFKFDNLKESRKLEMGKFAHMYHVSFSVNRGDNIF